VAEKVYALVDCNSFFCSCERLFRPELRHRPVGVLSNNDGCFVARTPELKALGVKMGEPYFKVRELCEKNNVAVFSSNFSLYTNISDRVMATLSQFAPEMEIYSVDEAFLDLTGLQVDLLEYARQIKETVMQWTGIPVSVGIGPSKTLAKVANNIGKKSQRANGAVVLLDKKLQDVALERTDVDDVWGIGKKTAIKLRSIGIRTAKDFRDYKNDHLIQTLLTKVGRRTQDELRGIACHELEVYQQDKKEIMCSRSFGNPVFELKDLREAVANYVTTASERMRHQNDSCALIEVFCHSNLHKEGETPFFARGNEILLTPTSDTRKIIKYAWNVLDDLYRRGILYKKAGIKLSGFKGSGQVQGNLFEQMDSEKSVKLMQVIDEINAREGEGTIHSMACGVSEKKVYDMRREKKSQRYVTGWNQLPKCG
jgi:DNA polymerase V